MQRFLAIVTAANLGLLLYVVGNNKPAAAQSPAPTLRARKLEIVDDVGKVRASIHVEPGGRTRDGKPYPETVILRLIDSNGQPSIKLATSLEGAGMSIVGGDDDSYVVLQADTKESSMKLRNKAGAERVVGP